MKERDIRAIKIQDKSMETCSLCVNLLLYESYILTRLSSSTSLPYWERTIAYLLSIFNAGIFSFSNLKINNNWEKYYSFPSFLNVSLTTVTEWESEATR